MSGYDEFPGGDRFEPWQDHEWPDHCGQDARYVGEVGERELAALSGGEVMSFVREHLESGAEFIVEEAIPPHAPAPGEAWDSTIHQFECVVCQRPILIWDMN